MVYLTGRLLRPIASFPIKQVKGLENLPKNIPFIIASNHSSPLDPPILGLIIPKYLKRKIYFISSAPIHLDLLANILFSDFFGSIRLKKKKKEIFIESAIKHLKKRHIVGIFPEGMTNRKSNLRRGKTGVARLVLKAKVPVVPIGIKGTFYVCYNFKKWLHKPKKVVTVNIGKPLYFKRYYGKDNNYSILRKITSVIMEEIASLTNKKYNF